MWRSLGRLDEAELVAPGGTRYAVGDRVVTLAPAAGGTVVTSETGTVVALNSQARSLSIRMDDDNEIRRLERPEIGAERLSLGYAVTVHRSQGSTVERAHALEDGGGRELAYVKMSRARDASTVYVVTDSTDQATEDLRREWGSDRGLGWVIDTGTPLTDPLSAEVSPQVARPMRHALRRGRLVAEREAILAVAPPDPGAQIRAAELQRSRLQRERQDLAAGGGRYRDHPVSHALWELRQAENTLARIERNLTRSGTSWADRRRWRAELADWQPKHAAAAARAVAGLQREAHQRWVSEHPEAALRLDHLTGEIDSLNRSLGDHLNRSDRTRSPDERLARVASIAHERNLGIDLGL